ncbi:MAG: CDP-glucose 4,6-dehydratase [Fibrobacterales bacterium]
MINKNFWNGKRVFITGNTGFKGSWLTLWLNSLGANIAGYALSPPTTPSLFKVLGLENDIDHTFADIRDLDKLKKSISSFKPDVVFHMAAQPLVRDSYIDPVGTYQTNVMGTVNVLESIRSVESVRAVISVTTDKCYENREWPWGYRENEAMGGYDPYSNSKGCAELVTSAYRNSFFNSENYGKSHQVSLASGRAGNVIGGGDWAKDRLIPDILCSFLKGEKVLIRSPYSIRPWQHVLEPLSGYITLAEKLFTDSKGEYAEGWNFGPDDKDAKPVEWIVEKMCSLWGSGASFEIDKSPQPHEATYLKLDISKAKSQLNWNPKWNLEKTLLSIIDWTKSFEGDNLKELTLSQIKEYEV